MSERNTVSRVLHDVGLAAWFGGSLMGAVGLNGAAASAKEASDRLRISSIGWARWMPVQLAAIAAHGVGGIGLIIGNRGRLAGQPGAGSNTVLKTGVTVAAGAASIVGGLAGGVIASHADAQVHGVTEPDGSVPPELATAQRVEKVTQWAIPALTGLLLLLAAQQGEQQHELATPRGFAKTAFRRVAR